MLLRRLFGTDNRSPPSTHGVLRALYPLGLLVISTALCACGRFTITPLAIRFLTIGANEPTRAEERIELGMQLGICRGLATGLAVTTGVETASGLTLQSVVRDLTIAHELFTTLDERGSDDEWRRNTAELRALLMIVNANLDAALPSAPSLAQPEPLVS